jgi:hypothetical protein
MISGGFEAMFILLPNPFAQFKRQLQKAEVGLKAYEKATEGILKPTAQSLA